MTRITGDYAMVGASMEAGTAGAVPWMGSAEPLAHTLRSGRSTISLRIVLGRDLASTECRPPR